MLTPGEQIGPYKIVGAIGAGGMGEVYRAHDQRLNRDVAIKVLPADRATDDGARQRFLREARAASALNHPNIITIYETDTANGVAFIAMEYVRGRTLADLLRDGKLSEEEAVRYAIQIADALAKAHAAGIVHRDLKPGNIMVTNDGLVKVLDFGLARVETLPSADSGSESPTRSVSFTSSPGTTLGTLYYMSPEQARGEVATTRSDIFSFGVVLFEMFTGELPFSGENLLAMLHTLHFGEAKDIRKLRPELADGLAAIVNRCLQKQPQDRYQSAGEIVRDLRGGRASGLGFANASSMAAASGPRTGSPSSAPAQSTSTAGIVQPAVQKSRRKWKREAVVASLVLLAAIFAIPQVRHGISSLWEKPQAASNSAQVAVPDNPFALQQQAQAYLERWDVPDNLDRSITLLNRAIELDNSYAPAYASLTFAYFEKNRLNADPQWVKQATQSANKAVQLNNELADAHLAAGVSAMLNGKNGDAEREFRRATELDPKSFKPHFWLGFMFNTAGTAKEAEAELNRALELAPDNWRARMNLGLLYYKTARYQEAAMAWEQVSKLTPDNFVVLNNLAAVYHQLDRYEDAAAVLQRSLQIKPDAYTYGNLGTLRFFQGRYEEAVPAFEKAVKLESNEYLWWGNLGDGYRWAPGQRSKAASAYENAIRLARERLAAHADDQDARTYLAIYLAKTGKKQDALAEIAKFDSTPQKDAENLFRSALVHELCGERDVALTTLSASAKQGYSFKEIRNEPELLSLRADPRYQTLVTSAAHK